jgi:hypothetical protein
VSLSGKPQVRYEDIADVKVRMGLFQKLRLLRFLAKHPEELTRCRCDVETEVSTTLGWASKFSCGNPRNKAQELRKAIKALKREMSSVRKEQRKLVERVGVWKQALGNVSVGGVEL